MRHNYVGDIGDFYKYRLLRERSGLTGNGPQRKLGVVWYLNEAPCKPTDGNNLHYLKPENAGKWKGQDENLFAVLNDIVQKGKRHIAEIERSGILGKAARFYDAPLPCFDSEKMKKADYINARARWVQGALDATAGCDLVFFDPDNGLEVKSNAIGTKQAVKYTYFDELKPFIARRQTLIIYQHQIRKKLDIYIEERKRQIKEHLGAELALDCQVFGSRMFFIISP